MRTDRARRSPCPRPRPRPCSPACCVPVCASLDGRPPTVAGVLSSAPPDAAWKEKGAALSSAPSTTAASVEFVPCPHHPSASRCSTIARAPLPQRPPPSRLMPARPPLQLPTAEEYADLMSFAMLTPSRRERNARVATAASAAMAASQYTQHKVRADGPVAPRALVTAPPALTSPSRPASPRRSRRWPMSPSRTTGPRVRRGTKRRTATWATPMCRQPLSVRRRCRSSSARRSLPHARGPPAKRQRPEPAPAAVPAVVPAAARLARRCAHGLPRVSRPRSTTIPGRTPRPTTARKCSSRHNRCSIHNHSSNIHNRSSRHNRSSKHGRSTMHSIHEHSTPRSLRSRRRKRAAPARHPPRPS